MNMYTQLKELPKTGHLVGAVFFLIPLSQNVLILLEGFIQIESYFMQS